MDGENANKAVLPRGLPPFLIKLHLGLLTVGLLTIVMGGVSIGMTKAYIYMSVVTAGVASSLSGMWGLLANRLSSVVLHSGCVATSSLALYLGIMALKVSLVRTLEYDDPFLIIFNTLVVLCDLVMDALMIGVQASVLWVSCNQQRSSR